MTPIEFQRNNIKETTMTTAATQPLRNRLLVQPSYNPDALLDALIARCKLKNDAALSGYLGVAPPVISRIRHRKLSVSDSILVRMHDATGMTIDDLRTAMGVAPKSGRGLI